MHLEIRGGILTQDCRIPRTPQQVSYVSHRPEAVLLSKAN